jgi:polyisoprenoid-binding protein YceI
MRSEPVSNFHMRPIVVALFLLSAPLLADPKTYTIAGGAPSLVTFHVEDNVDPFDGRTENVTGTIVADPAAPGQSKVEVTVDLASLDTGNKLRNSHMREKYLHTQRFPKATFQSVSIAGPSSIAPSQPADLAITGDFTLHGVTKRVTIPVKATLLADGRIHVISRFPVRMPDYGIAVPKNILVTVNDAVEVRLDLFATAN